MRLVIRIVIFIIVILGKGGETKGQINSRWCLVLEDRCRLTCPDTPEPRCSILDQSCLVTVFAVSDAETHKTNKHASLGPIYLLKCKFLLL